MTTSNPAVGARSGTFFVDRPDGFVWWVTSQRAPSGVRFRWARFYGLRACDWDYATQEEAEAAGLVPLVVAEPTVKAVAYPTAPIPVPESARPAPAPLDPEGHVSIPGFGKWLPRGLKYLFEQIGVPEGGCAVMEAVDAVLDGRQSAPLDPGSPEHLRQVADLFPYVRGYAESPHHAVALSAREWLEAEADRLDRERAEADQDAALAGIRAGRAEGSAS